MILVFDIGTTVLKGGIIDPAGSLAVHLRQSLVSPVHADSGINGLSPERWLETFIAVSRRLIHIYKSKGIKAQIEGVVISGNGPTFVPVDAKGNPVSKAISWAHQKSRAFIEELREKTGGKVDPSFYLAKAFFLFKQEPVLYRRVQWFLPCPEYISFFLTENAYAFLPAPGYTAYMWTDDAVIRTGMDKDKFPPLIYIGEETGKVSKTAGVKTGIPSGTPVFAGGPDFIMSLLGTGTIEAGRICDRTGTSEGINICSKYPVDYKNLTTIPHIRKGFYNISCILPFAGKILDWFLQLLNNTPDVYSQLYFSLAHIPPGSEQLFFLPYMEKHPTSVASQSYDKKGWTQSSLWPPYRRGIFAGLTLKHKREHLFKAILEGLGYAVREIFELFEKKGFNSREVRVSGIQASYDEWNKLRANILGRRILVPFIKDTELTGCACIGLSSLGYFTCIDDAVKNLVRIEKIFEPDAGLHRFYTDLFGIYKKIYTQTDSVFQDLMEYNRDSTIPG